MTKFELLTQYEVIKNSENLYDSFPQIVPFNSSDRAISYFNTLKKHTSALSWQREEPKIYRVFRIPIHAHT